MPEPLHASFPMRELVVPCALRAGDRVAALTLSWGGPGEVPGRYLAGKRQLEAEFDVEVVEMPHTCASAEAVASNVVGRVADLHAAFADPSIAAIISTIGGDDSIRMLPMLDLDVIRANPKIVLGYSDTTILHAACGRAGLRTFYGPSIMSGFGENGGLHPYLVDGVRRMLFTTEPPGDWCANPDGWTVDFVDWSDPNAQSVPRPLEHSRGFRFGGSGRVEGPLFAACVEVFDWLRGTPWWPDLTGAVLAVETSEEGMSPAGLSYFLRALGVHGDLHRIVALLVGRPGGVKAETHRQYDRAIESVVRTELGLTDLPIVTNLDFGHSDPMWTLPIGARTVVDVGSERITFPDRVTA